MKTLTSCLMLTAAIAGGLASTVGATPPEPLKPLPSHGAGSPSPAQTGPAPSAKVPAAGAATPGAAAPGVTTAGGVRWVVPKAWTEQPARMMRVATYAVPAATGAEAGECAVFFFGAGQGGGIDDNVRRWASQFEGAAAPVRATKTVQGLTVHTVAVSGTFLAPSGPMMQSSGKKAGWQLRGAIVEAPDGNVFFKLTGPTATVAGASAAFDALVASLRKGV